MSICEYVWIGGGNELRSKIRVIYQNSILLLGENVTIDMFPEWNFDGSSTGQASGEDSEVIIKPCAFFRNPNMSYNSYLVMCDTYKPTGEPLPNNHRVWANEVFNKKLDEEPWYGLEQEYFLISNEDKPINLPYGKEPQGQYYCSVGAKNAFGRYIAEEHLQICIRAGINISGINAEVAPGQWEFQIGPCTGIESGDHLWMARYLLQRVAEKYNMNVNFEPKPFKGDVNGSGCHANYSTKEMREENGFTIINEAILKLSVKHKEHMDVYGTDNDQRMTGLHETASYDKFSFGIAHRGNSIRIGNKTFDDKQGYFEDRRPSSNCDPYLVTAMLFQTTCLD
tara:strand:+ start:3040 stop:4056 length:1017 start_codon:yes stop_codon:yes gene_type:complete